MNIFVVGDVMLDIDLRGRFRENYEGAIHCITGQRWRYYPGGAANVAAVLRWLGHRVSLFGLVGPDWAAVELERLLGNIKHHFRSLLPATIVKLRAYAQNKLICRVDCERPVSIDWAAEACYQRGQQEGIPDCVVFSDYNKGVFGLHSREAVQRIIQWECPVVVDPRPCDYLEIWDGATVATPNLRESEQIEINTQHLIVTSGGKGADLYSGGKGRHIQCSRVAGAQIVGAGDAFAGSLAGALAQGRDMYEAAKFAVQTATDYVSRPRWEIYQQGARGLAGANFSLKPGHGQ